MFNIAKEHVKYIKEQYIHRVRICDTCEYLDKWLRCSDCGCFVTAKTAIPTAKCPKGKW